MIMMDQMKIYPRSKDRETVYLKNVISDPNIIVGDYTMYNDFVNNPTLFEKNNVLYHYPINHDKLYIGKFCSLACGVRFLFNSANHSMASLSKVIRKRFSDDVISALLKTQWWDWPADKIAKNIEAIQSGNIDCL